MPINSRMASAVGEAVVDKLSNISEFLEIGQQFFLA